MKPLLEAVLVVDDDLALAGLLAMSLAAEGYQVAEAHSAHTAIKILQAQPEIKLMVLDMGMPPNEHTPAEGLKVLDWMAEKSPLTKVLVLTGQNAESTSYQAILHGAFDFLEKPVVMPFLLASLARASLFNRQSIKIKDQEGVHKIALDLHVGDGVKKVRNAAELKLLQLTLSETGFNVHETARRLGLKRENVYYLIKKYGIERD